VHVVVTLVVDLIRVEVWMLKNPLYQVFQLSSVGIVSTEVVLQHAFAPFKDIGCIRIQVGGLQPLQPPELSGLEPPPAAARECLALAVQCQQRQCKRHVLQQ
jgi:hypothetical protein